MIRSRRIKTILVSGLALGALGAGIATWSAAGSSPADGPKVSGFDTAPAISDAETRFASLKEYLANPLSVRIAGRHSGLDWYYASGANSDVCLISIEPTGANLGMVCTPPEDGNPSDLRVSRDTSGGKDVSAVVVPDADTAVRVEKGPGAASAIDHNLVVVDQSDDVVLSATDTDGRRTEIDLPDRVRHHGAGTMASPPAG